MFITNVVKSAVNLPNKKGDKPIPTKLIDDGIFFL